MDCNETVWRQTSRQKKSTLLIYDFKKPAQAPDQLKLHTYGIGALVWNIPKELGYLGLLAYNSPDPNSISAFCHLQPQPTTPSI